MQKTIIVTGYWGNDGWEDTTDELNELLEQGWNVKNMTPMGAFGYGYGYGDSDINSDSDNGFASLVLLEK